jgi:hypothetical protein
VAQRSRDAHAALAPRDGFARTVFVLCREDALQRCVEAFEASQYRVDVPIEARRVCRQAALVSVPVGHVLDTSALLVDNERPSVAWRRRAAAADDEHSETLALTWPPSLLWVNYAAMRAYLAPRLTSALLAHDSGARLDMPKHYWPAVAGADNCQSLFPTRTECGPRTLRARLDEQRFGYFRCGRGGPSQRVDVAPTDTAGAALYSTYAAEAVHRASSSSSNNTAAPHKVFAVRPPWLALSPTLGVCRFGCGTCRLCAPEVRAGSALLTRAELPTLLYWLWLDFAERTLAHENTRRPELGAWLVAQSARALSAVSTSVRRAAERDTRAPGDASARLVAAVRRSRLHSSTDTGGGGGASAFTSGTTIVFADDEGNTLPDQQWNVCRAVLAAATAHQLDPLEAEVVFLLAKRNPEDAHTYTPWSNVGMQLYQIEPDGTRLERAWHWWSAENARTAAQYDPKLFTPGAPSRKWPQLRRKHRGDNPVRDPRAALRSLVSAAKRHSGESEGDRRVLQYRADELNALYTRYKTKLAELGVSFTNSHHTTSKH